MRTVAFCEIDPYCRQVLAKHWPRVPCHTDIRTLAGSDVGQVHVIAGGFPCQDISPAGKREGIGGARSGLWKDYARLIGELRPGYAVMENSAELLANGLGDVLGDLASIGYDAKWDCIPAAALGAPHGRDRIWIVAYAPQIPWVHEPDVGAEFRCWLLDDRNAWPASPYDSSEAAVCRVDDGIPNRVDRTGSLGNAVVPQIPEIIGRAIMKSQSQISQAAE